MPVFLSNVRVCRRVGCTAATAGALALSVFVAGCGRGAQGAPREAGGSAAGPPPMPVSVVTAQRAPVEDSSEYIGTVKAMRSTEVHPEVDGRITRILARSGDHVGQGQPLLQIDPARQQASVASDEASVQAREADLRFARQQLDRLRELFTQRVVSKAELDRAETAVETAEAALAATRAEVREGRVQLQYYQVLAPTPGMVGDVPVRVGDRVTRDTLLTTIDSNDELEVLVAVPGERATDLRIGLRMELLGQDGGVVGDTTISFISPRVDPETQAVLAKGLMRNGTGHLRSQQILRTRIIWASREGLTVPVLSVLRVGGQPFVFVAERQGDREVARQRPVTLGAILGDAYTVLNGVKEGDRVIVSGIQKLSDGAPVQAQAQPQPPAQPAT